MDSRGRKRPSFGPLTPAQLSRRVRWRQSTMAGAMRRLQYGNVYRPNLMKARRTGSSLYPDKGYHDDEDSLDPFGVAGVRRHIDMPALGQGKNQRHTSKIKVWSLNIKGVLHLAQVSTTETVVAEFFLLWSYRPNGAVLPDFNEIYTSGSTMTEVSNSLIARMKHEKLAEYKQLARKKITLVKPTNSSAGSNRKTFTVQLKFKGRNAKYLTFQENATLGNWTDLKSGGFFYFIRFVSSDANARMEGHVSSRMIYYH
nr:V1 protein [Apple geminivirus]